MSFGFSVGDFIAVGGVITDIISCLNDSTGSKSDYQELVRELQALDQALKSLDRLNSSGSSSGTVDSIKCAALSCRVPLEQFLGKIRKYEGTLGPRASSSSIASSSKTALRKITWLSKAEDIDRLRKYLGVHLGTINILLLEHGLQTLEFTSQAMKEQGGDIMDSLRGIDRVVTSTAANVQNQTALVRTSHNILTSLFAMVSGELRSSISQITRFTQNACLLSHRIFEAVVQLQASVSSMAVDTRWTYFQPPVRVEDPLGRVFPVPSEYSMCELHALLRYRFRRGPGRRHIRDGNFRLTDRRNKVALDRTSMPELLPGLDIIMSILLDVTKCQNTADTCPITQCSSRNTIPASWGGRSCLDCGRWYHPTDETSQQASNTTNSRKRRIEEVDSDDGSSDSDNTTNSERSWRNPKRTKKNDITSEAADLGYFRNISCVRSESPKRKTKYITHAVTREKLEELFRSFRNRLDEELNRIPRGMSAKTHDWDFPRYELEALEVDPHVHREEVWDQAVDDETEAGTRDLAPTLHTGESEGQGWDWAF